MCGPAPPPSSRLASDVLPTHYSLAILTDLEAQRFEGSAEIDIVVHAAVEQLVLNVDSPLQLKAALLVHATEPDRVRHALSLTFDADRQRVAISFAGGAIAVGTARIALHWEGALTGSMQGYYTSTYPRQGGAPGSEERSAYALTQFEATKARKAFPCFDEPAIKSTFSISLVHRRETVALSNMNCLSTTQLGADGQLPRTTLLSDEFFLSTTPSTGALEKGADKAGEFFGEYKNAWIVSVFATSPKMSTYLVAWANGVLEHIADSYVSPLTGKTIPLRVYTTYEHIAQAQLALSTTKRCMPLYEQMFDIAYPLPKLDTLVASDFDAGAMENWGLITGRTSVYLFDEKNSGIAAKKQIVATVSHECSHLHFGDLVGIEFWHLLFLKEAFATIVGECMMVQLLEPSWKTDASFVAAQFAMALKADSLRSSHPIEMPCPDENAIAQMFDQISYLKGASVLRMLCSMLGSEVFLKGVSIYLKKHAYSHAETADLWAGISESSGQDVPAIMKNWTEQVGFPVVSVEETQDGLTVRQNRFLSTGDPTPEEDTTVWHVPLELKTIVAGKAEVDHKAMLTTRETTLAIKDVANAIYKLNAETTGVYRTLYSPARLATLGDEAGKVDSAFSLNDRMGLVQDASVLASAGLLKTSAALSFIAKQSHEKEYLVWKEISSCLTSLTTTWWEQSAEDRAGLEQFRRDLFGPIAERLGFESMEGDDEETIELRSLAISNCAIAGDKRTLAEYKRRFDALVEQNDDSLIPSDLRASIYALSVKHGGEREYLKILEIYRNPSAPAVKIAAIAALCAADDLGLLQRTFAFSFSSEVKPQDLMYFVAYLARNPASARMTWAVFQQHYAMIAEGFKGSSLIRHIVTASFSRFSTETDAKAVEAFFEDKDVASFALPLKQGLDAVRSQAAWLGRDVEDVHQWLLATGRISE